MAFWSRSVDSTGPVAELATIIATAIGDCADPRALENCCWEILTSNSDHAASQLGFRIVSAVLTQLELAAPPPPVTLGRPRSERAEDAST